MLRRAPANVVTPAQGYFPSASASSCNKRLCKVWLPGRGDSLLCEPTSVLDVRSPSPSSTLSSSGVGGSCDGGALSTESGGAVAVSRPFCCEGGVDRQKQQTLPDNCTGLLDGKRGLQAWEIAQGDGGGRAEDWAMDVGAASTWHSSTESGPDAWERISGVPAAEEVRVCGGLHGAGFAASMAAAGGVVLVGTGPIRGNVGGDDEGKGLGRPVENVCKVEQQQQQYFSFPMSSASAAGGPPLQDALRAGEIKQEVAEGRLEACVIQCFRQAGKGAGHEALLEGWVGGNNNNGSNEWKGFKEEETAGLEDLDEMLPPETWWGSEDGTALSFNQLQEVKYGGRGTGSPAAPIDSMSNAASCRSQQLDLYEAMQAGLLYSSSSGSRDRGNVAAPQAAPASSSSSTSTLLPTFLSVDSKLPSATPAFTSAPPPFQPFSELLPTSPQLFSLPPFNPPPQQIFKPTHRTSEPPTVPVDSKPWQIPKVPPMWQPKAEPPGSGWQVCGSAVIQPPLPPPLAVHAPAQPTMAALGLQQQQHQQRQQQQQEQQQQQGRRRLLPADAAGVELPPPPRVVGRGILLEDLRLAQRQLSAALEAADLGNIAIAQAILARLNHLSSPQGHPSQRAIFYFTEAVAKRVAPGLGSSSSSSSSSPPSVLQQQSFDIIAKIGACKSFCEASPIPQFAQFTANQAILEAMEGEDVVHIIDFELGLGGQWASFMQELSQRSRGPPQMVKITTIGGSGGSMEMQLAKENLVQFARELGVNLQVEAMAAAGLGGLRAGMVKRGEGEAVAVNFGYGLVRAMSEFAASAEALVGFLQLVKGLAPKVVTVVDCEYGLEGGGAAQHLLEALRFYACVCESVECGGGGGLTREAERMVLGPKIEALLRARTASTSKAVAMAPSSSSSSSAAAAALECFPPWRLLLQSTGFSPSPLSHAAETQAACLLRHHHSHSGFFSIKKQHGVLYLLWLNTPLLAASSWV